jgi:hypothetical protein
MTSPHSLLHGRDRLLLIGSASPELRVLGAQPLVLALQAVITFARKSTALPHLRVNFPHSLAWIVTTGLRKLMLGHEPNERLSCVDQSSEIGRVAVDQTGARVIDRQPQGANKINPQSISWTQGALDVEAKQLSRLTACPLQIVSPLLVGH